MDITLDYLLHVLEYYISRITVTNIFRVEVASSKNLMACLICNESTIFCILKKVIKFLFIKYRSI